MPKDILDILFKKPEERNIPEALTLYRWLISISANSTEFKMFYQLNNILK